MTDTKITYEYTTVRGDAAIDALLRAAPNAHVMLTTSGFDCDSGNYERTRKSDPADAMWAAMLYRAEPKRFSARYVENEYGMPTRDWIEFSIDSGDEGEPSVDIWTFRPANPAE